MRLSADRFKKALTFSRTRRDFRSGDISAPSWDLAGRMLVDVWMSTVKRADALHASESAAGGVDLISTFLPPGVNYRSTVRALSCVGVP